MVAGILDRLERKLDKLSHWWAWVSRGEQTVTRNHLMKINEEAERQDQLHDLVAGKGPSAEDSRL